MKTFELERTQRIDRPVEEIFPFFADAHNLESITPPWLRFQIDHVPGRIEARVRIAYRLRWRLIPIRWLTEIAEWEPMRRFVDVQLRGPYRLWHHTHEFETYAGGTIMRDVLRYALPYRFLGRVAHRMWVRRDIEAIFDYRAERIHELFCKE